MITIVLVIWEREQVYILIIRLSYHIFTEINLSKSSAIPLQEFKFMRTWSKH